MPARTPFYLDVGNNNVVQLQLVSVSYSAPLKAALGILDGQASGEPPTGKTLVGKGKLAALERGGFAINAVYAATATKTQTVKLLCAPSKADTAFGQLKGLTYRGKNITDARVPRRRIYSF